MKRIFTITLPDRLPDYIPALDGLRGMAILLVMAYHCFPFLYTKLGWIGVDLFFVLSGFLITGILLDTKGEKGYYRNFIIRRILRIFPLYYLVLFIVFALLPIFGLSKIRGENFAFYVNNQAWFWTYMQNWLYSIHGFPANHLLVHFWSLAVEEQFYLFWPILIALTSRKYLLPLFSTLIIISIIFRLKLGYLVGFTYTYPYLSTLSRMDALIVGATIAYLIRYSKNKLERITPYLSIFSFIAFTCCVVFIKSLNFLNLPPSYTFLDLFFGCILLYSLSNRNNWIAGISKGRILKFFGKYSYGLYVYHYIIYEITAMFFFRVNEENGIPVTSASAKIGLGAGVVLISVLVSLASYHFWEKPFLKLKKHFSLTRKKMTAKSYQYKLIEAGK